MRIYFGIAISLLFFTCESYGQTWLELDEPRPEVMLEVFQDYLPIENARKIHGRTYFNPYPGIDEHQFFKTRQLSAGMVYTQKDTIKCDHILYDISRDRLIVFSNHVHKMIELEEEFITHFQLLDKANHTTYRFINAKFIEDFPESSWPGFYQVVYHGPGLGFYKKHIKTYSAKPVREVYVTVFNNREQLILQQDDQYIHVRNKKDLLRQYPGSENEIKKYFRQFKIKLKKASDEEIWALGSFLNQLG